MWLPEDQWPPVAVPDKTQERDGLPLPSLKVAQRVRDMHLAALTATIGPNPSFRWCNVCCFLLSYLHGLILYENSLLLNGTYSARRYK